MRRIQAGNLTIEGESVSGIATCIAVAELDVLLDIGFCPTFAPQYRDVLITHAHIDHLGAAANHACTRAMKSLTPTRFFVPPSVVDGLKELLALWERLQSQTGTPCEIIPLAPGESFELRRGVFVKAFKTDHRIDSQGYMVIERRNKLRAEFAVLSGIEIANLRKIQGIDVTEVSDVIRLVYTGDTRTSIWDTNDEIVKAQVVITEATFVDGEKNPEHASLRGHTHLEDIAARADRFAQVEHLVLTHFSARHDKWETITNAMATLPEPLRSKVTPL